MSDEQAVNRIRAHVRMIAMHVDAADTAYSRATRWPKDSEQHALLMAEVSESEREADEAIRAMARIIIADNLCGDMTGETLTPYVRSVGK